MSYEKAAGAVFGTAYGDAFGRPTEFLTVKQALAVPMGKPRMVTDDTMMMLSLGDALEAADTLGPTQLAQALRLHFVKWSHADQSGRAPGGTCMAACRRLDAHAERWQPWQQCTDVDSKGCGANMRVAPVGLLLRYPWSQAAGIAQLSAAMTHGHPTAIVATELTALAVRLLADGHPLDRRLIVTLLGYLDSRVEYRRDWLGDLFECAAVTYETTRSTWPRPEMATTADEWIGFGIHECDRSLREALKAIDAGYRGKGDPCTLAGDGWIAEEALATSLLCAITYPSDPETALWRATRTRGDSDTLGAITGMLVGAACGIDAFPAQWKQSVEFSGKLDALAKLVA